MNLRGLDLNLLVILDALLDEAHVTRAADRLALSQPAASSALERCRHLFADPLLERVGRRMRLTPRAQALRAPLKEILAQVDGLVDRSPRALGQLSQVVRIAMADVPAAMVLPALHARLVESAPGVDLVVPPWYGSDAELAQLRSGEIDLALSVFPPLGAEFRRHELHRETYAVAMRKGHPAARSFDLERWLAYPHLLISGRGDRSGPLDDALARIGRQRRIGMVLPSFLIALPLLHSSDHIALLPRTCFAMSGAENLLMREPPLAVEGFPLHLAWHARRDQDPAVRHVAALLQDIIAGLVKTVERRARSRRSP
ncbi:LysR family transcriptional regulator [Niveibacterium sp. SC-1]|uniref:LysR family transcriptional regulator n=1 Tax=Niveibacterium sp. SC-1 TaxID=3135646 RepID=UPI00311F17A3